MLRKDDIKKLITNHARRLLKLKEQRALRGINADPDLLIEIEDTEAELERLNTELEKIEAYGPILNPRIFISYKRNVEPDESVALQIFREFHGQYDVFIDQTMPVGTNWVEQIKSELTQADFFIVFLSAASVYSQMVQEEIEIAHHQAKSGDGRPVILPVRLAYREPFRYPLSAYLDPINWAFWRNHQDTPRLIKELQAAIAGGSLPVDEHLKPKLLLEKLVSSLPEPLPAAQPIRLEMPEGTMEPESKFYVERSKDATALKTIEDQGVTITIKAPRQMGKSSLLMRIINAARKAGKQIAFLDFQLFDQAALNNADVFFRQFCAWLTDELDLDDRVDEFWNKRLSNSQSTTNYLGRYLLKELDTSLVLAMDEVDSVFDTDFRSDFFGMLRSWHNKRSSMPLWKQLDLVLVTSTEPYLLIENMNQSPFNVGVVIELEDFTPEQVSDLNSRHGSPLSQSEERQLMTLLGGHPYLVRRALYLVASQSISVAQLFTQATDQRGPFGDHLRYHLFRLQGKEELIHSFRQIIHHYKCQNERIFFRLQGAGLVRREGHLVRPRCKLYADFFGTYLDG